MRRRAFKTSARLSPKRSFAESQLRGMPSYSHWRPDAAVCVRLLSETQRRLSRLQGQPALHDDVFPLERLRPSSSDRIAFRLILAIVPASGIVAYAGCLLAHSMTVLCARSRLRWRFNP